VSVFCGLAEEAGGHEKEEERINRKQRKSKSVVPDCSKEVESVGSRCVLTVAKRVRKRALATDQDLCSTHIDKTKEIRHTKRDESERERAPASSSLLFCAQCSRAFAVDFNSETHPPPGLLRLVAENGGLHRGASAVSESGELRKRRKRKEKERKKKESTGSISSLSFFFRF